MQNHKIFYLAMNEQFANIFTNYLIEYPI